MSDCLSQTSPGRRETLRGGTWRPTRAESGSVKGLSSEVAHSCINGSKLAIAACSPHGASSVIEIDLSSRVANWFLTLGGHSWLLLCTGWLGRGEYGQLCRSKIRYHLVSLSRRPRLMGGGCLSGWVTGQASLSPHARHAAPSRHSASPTAWQGEAPHMPSPSSLLRPYGRGQGMYENKIHGPAVIHLWQPSGHPPGLHSRPPSPATSAHRVMPHLEREWNSAAALWRADPFAA